MSKGIGDTDLFIGDLLLLAPASSAFTFALVALACFVSAAHIQQIYQYFLI
jgi:hypothetical protein